MTGGDYSQSTNVQGNVTVAAEAIGDYDKISNPISESGKDETQAHLETLLTELQAAIIASHSLSEEEKTEALTEVREISASGQSFQDATMKRAARRSINTLKGILLSSEEATHLTETESVL